jgi:exopolyphosphatase / guanosine-5'-triphosphate,3'-diphosphate pyrophosphatase
MNAAAIDLGTNSIKILIVRRDRAGHMQVLFRHRAVVRLGEGTFLKENGGNIPRHVQLRTLKIFQTYAQFLDSYKVDIVRATGTSALRDAKNGPDFVKEVRDKTGIALEVLPADEEARLIVKGVSSEYSLPRKPVIFIDIGGGSCEISLVQKKKIEKFVSLPLGAVRLTELFVPDKKPDPAKLRRLDNHIRKTLNEYWPNPPSVKSAFGSAGTIRALARLISKTELTDDERSITKQQIERTAFSISKMSYKRIMALPGIDSKRAEILTAGVHVLREIFTYFKIDSLKVSNRGLREGMLLDLFDRPQKPNEDPLLEQEQEQLELLSDIGHQYHFNRNHTYQVWTLSRLLFNELGPVHGLPEKDKKYLMVAALLHDVGRYINKESSHKHTYYILRNTNIPFLNDREKLFVATLARYHRKSPPKEGHEGYTELSPEEKKQLEVLASILRLADALDAPHDQGVKWVKCQWGPGKVHIYVEMKGASQLDPVTIKDKAKLFETLFKVEVTVGPVSEMKTARNFTGSTAVQAGRAKLNRI